jgi:small ligand-binding sensory domain FIST
MFGSAQQEVAYVQEILGGVPLAGFYANGEIAGERIYGFTGVLALF